MYAFKKIWKWDKAFCFYYLPIIPLAILLPLAAAYFPKLVINAVEAQQSIFEITIIIGIYFASLFLIQIHFFLHQYIGQDIEYHCRNYRKSQ